MRHGSLFSGIGGFDLAAEWMGWSNVFHCEWNEFGRKVLNYYWPEAKSYDDITKTDFSIWRGKIDILTGGFPCQPYSGAGKRLGTEDDRHLWPEMLRAVREIQPSYVVAENVLGLVNWNEGLVFHEVQTDLETEGYEVQPFILPACAIGAPHRRDRVWFIAYSESKGLPKRQEIDRREKYEQKRSDIRYNSGTTSKIGIITDTDGIRDHRNNKSKGGNNEREQPKDTEQPGYRWPSKIERYGTSGISSNTISKRTQSGGMQSEIHRQTEKNKYDGNNRDGYGWFDSFPQTEPTIHIGNDGISSRLDGITFPKWRSESIKGGGNAIVPQVAHQIFKAINKLYI